MHPNRSCLARPSNQSPFGPLTLLATTGPATTAAQGQGHGTGFLQGRGLCRTHLGLWAGFLWGENGKNVNLPNWKLQHTAVFTSCPNHCLPSKASLPRSNPAHLIFLLKQPNCGLVFFRAPGYIRTSAICRPQVEQCSITQKPNIKNSNERKKQPKEKYKNIPGSGKPCE